jgi:hypothetical protein
MLKGAVPGAEGAYVRVRDSIKNKQPRKAKVHHDEPKKDKKAPKPAEKKPDAAKPAKAA